MATFMYPMGALTRRVHNEWAMKDCCEVMVDVPARQRRVLQSVLGINAGMFLMEFGAGLLAGSTALLADSADMLGDALGYGFSLHVVSRGTVWQARAARSRNDVREARRALRPLRTP